MYYSDRKKQRGQRRKLAVLCRSIDELAPFSDTERKYEHFHVGDNFIGHPKTSSNVKTAFCRKILDTTENFIAHKPADLPFCRVVAAICPSNLCDSQIIIFYDKDYYEHFWERNTPDRTRIEIEDTARSFAKERNIDTRLSEKGYFERYLELEVTIEQALWFYGEL